MGLRGWRLFGVAGTIFIYVAGILFLSLMNMPNPHPKKVRLGRFGEINSLQSPELTGLSRRQPIQWCKELSFLNRPFIKENIITKENPRRSLTNYSTISKDSTSRDVTSGSQDVWSGGVPESGSTSEFTTNFGRELTALASFPGSGNTWLRYLLQQSTGYLTGSVYKDYGLLKSGFPAENICNESVLVVKTHEWGYNHWLQFRKAILLVRDPGKAILAEFNRQSGGHVGFASPDRYKRTKGRYWQQFVNNKLNGWEHMNLEWAKHFSGILKIIYYDDLVNDVETKLREILKFLNLKIDEELLSCTLLRKEGIYRRKKRILSFDPYSPAMREQIEKRKLKVYNMLGRHD